MKKTSPHISVIIPAYNEEKYLPRCLKALEKQTYSKDKFDIIVVDNNSTDKTPTIAKKYGASVLREKRQGHVFSLNAGLKKATGDILAVTDADSIPSKDWLMTMAKIFQDPTIVGVTGTLSLDSKSKIANKLFKNIHHSIQTLHFALHKPTFYGPNMALTKNAFKKLKEVDTRYKIGGDAEIGMRLRKHGKVKFNKNLAVTTSSRRFNGEISDLFREISKYTNAYIYTIWLEKPPKNKLTPIR